MPTVTGCAASLLIQEHGEGRLRKGFARPVIGVTDAQYRFPPMPARFCCDGAAAARLSTEDCDCGSDPLLEVASTPTWPVYGLKHVLVGEDAITKKLKPVTEYATVEEFLVEAVGVADGIVNCEEKCITVYQEAVMRMWLESPLAIGLNDMWTLEADPATTNLHMFRAALTVDPELAIGRSYSARTEAKNYVDVLISFPRPPLAPVV